MGEFRNTEAQKIVAVFGFVMILVLAAGCSDTRTSGASEDEWQFGSQRPELAPGYRVDPKVLYEGKATLVLSGKGKAYANGCWSKTLDVIPGNFYRFRTCFSQEKVEEPNRSILARIVWQAKDSSRVGQPEYPATLQEKTANGWSIIQQDFQVPENAVTAKIELIYRWDIDGCVHFSRAGLEEIPELQQRFVSLAAIHYRPTSTRSLQENLDQFRKYIEIASAKGADIVCLPEAITLVGRGKTFMEVSEPVPGPGTEFLGNTARENNLYIVAGLIERDGSVLYNTAVLLDRKGILAGKYRKASLPREEIEGGLTPGNSFSVFDTDFGRIGMMICWDLQFPEAARMLTLQGAEVIFMPIWGGNLTLAKARAIENQIYLVSSSYNMKTGVFDQEGELIAEATADTPVAVVTVDLDKQKLWSWLGDFKNRIPREIPSSKTIAY